MVERPLPHALPVFRCQLPSGLPGTDDGLGIGVRLLPVPRRLLHLPVSHPRRHHHRPAGRRSVRLALLPTHVERGHIADHLSLSVGQRNDQQRSAQSGGGVGLVQRAQQLQRVVVHGAWQRRSHRTATGGALPRSQRPHAAGAAAAGRQPVRRDGRGAAPRRAPRHRRLQRHALPQRRAHTDAHSHCVTAECSVHAVRCPHSPTPLCVRHLRCGWRSA